jgi:hypothetical protein
MLPDVFGGFAFGYFCSVVVVLFRWVLKMMGSILKSHFKAEVSYLMMWLDKPIVYINFGVFMLYSPDLVISSNLLSCEIGKISKIDMSYQLKSCMFC